jgi:hypothetical protein
LIVGYDDPKQEQDVSDYANNAISHETGSKLEVLEDKDKDEKDSGVDDRVDPAEIVRRNQADPLDDDQLEV